MFLAPRAQLESVVHQRKSLFPRLFFTMHARSTRSTRQPIEPQTPNPKPQTVTRLQQRHARAAAAIHRQKGEKRVKPRPKYYNRNPVVILLNFAGNGSPRMFSKSGRKLKPLRVRRKP